MNKKSSKELSDLQKDVMKIIWKHGEASVHQVLEELNKKRKLAYTSVLTTMQRLEKAGWLKHRQEGKAYVYLPTQSQTEERNLSLRNFLQRIFKNDTSLLLQHLIEEEFLSDQELENLQQMIQEKRRRQDDER